MSFAPYLSSRSLSTCVRACVRAKKRLKVPVYYINYANVKIAILISFLLGSVLGQGSRLDLSFSSEYSSGSSGRLAIHCCSLDRLRSVRGGGSSWLLEQDNKCLNKMNTLDKFVSRHSASVKWFWFTVRSSSNKFWTPDGAAWPVGIKKRSLPQSMKE